MWHISSFTMLLADNALRELKLTLVLQARELPGVNAFHCEGTGWTFDADEQNKIEFCGNYANFR